MATIGSIFSSVTRFISSYFFTEFGFYTFLYLCLSTFFKRSIFKKADEEATGFIALAGVVYAITLIINVVLALTNTWTNDDQYLILNRMFGPYWFGFWLQPILWIAVTQLLRIKRIRENTTTRLVFGILLIIPIEMFVIIVTSLHRDFTPSNLAYFQPTLPPLIYIIAIPLNILFFLICVGMYYGLKLMIRRIIKKKPVNTLIES